VSCTISRSTTQTIDCRDSHEHDLRKDLASAIAQYRELKAGKTAGEYNFAETELNQLGYQLLQQKR